MRLLVKISCHVQDCKNCLKRCKLLGFVKNCIYFPLVLIYLLVDFEPPNNKSSIGILEFFLRFAGF